jgi:uncharacterized protein YkwD
MCHGVARGWARIGAMLLLGCATLGAAPPRDLASATARDTVIEVVEADDGEPATTAQGTDAQRQALVDAVVKLTNAERAKAGAPSLQPNESLMRAAQTYAAVLGSGPCFDHTCPPVPDLRDRVVNEGYVGWRRLGENLAAGNPTPESAMASWMRSPGHRANLLRAEYREIGVGVLSGTGEYGIYWVQDFGTRAQ